MISVTNEDEDEDEEEARTEFFNESPPTVYGEEESAVATDAIKTGQVKVADVYVRLR